MGTYENKTREIKRSLNRRARLRRNYFKMIGEDPRKKAAEAKARKIEDGKSIDLSDASDSEEEAAAPGEPEPEEPKPVKLTGKQLASRRRAEKYHQQREKEEELKRKQVRRIQHKNVMKSKTSRGQPKLGSQIGVLLDKIKEKNQ